MNHKQGHSTKNLNIQWAPLRTNKNIQWKLFGVTGSGADPGFGQGGAPASEAESCRHSKVEPYKWSEPLAAGVQGPLKGPGNFWVFNAQICILLHSRGSFSLIFDR